MPIKTGHYFIINVETSNLAYLANPNSEEPIQSRYQQEDPDEQANQKWDVRNLKNGQHTVINICHKQYAASGNRSEVGEPVHGWEREQTWRIQKTGVKGQYTISTTDSKYFWGLGDREQGTPIALADVPTDRRNWWMFKDAETGKDAELDPAYDTATGDMIPHVHEVRKILSQSPYVVQGAIHDSAVRYPPSECHPGTREDILSIALDWANKPLDESESQIFWLYGPAGVGKTAIVQTFCQRLKERGRLGGDFFLSRLVPGYSDLSTLFPTLVYQLALAYPEFGLYLNTTIKTDESILTKNMRLQLEQLMVNPLKQVDNVSDNLLVLVIDGLDEAGGESEQTLLLQLLGLNFLGHRLPLKIFLTSRPELWIKDAFGKNPLLGGSQSHFLARTSQTDNDIRIVLNSGCAKIQETHDLMKSRSDGWPPSKIIDDIVEGASGQFIYVSTILRYIGDPNGDPARRLQRIAKTLFTGRHEFNPLPSTYDNELDDPSKRVLPKSSQGGDTVRDSALSLNLVSKWFRPRRKPLDKKT